MADATGAEEAAVWVLAVADRAFCRTHLAAPATIRTPRTTDEARGATALTVPRGGARTYGFMPSVRDAEVSV
jgi:hypothetical protein